VAVRADGSVADAIDYDALGAVVRRRAASAVRYEFTGHEHDDVLGLGQFRARFYDPALGRFLGTDPQGQFHSPYLYAGNNPVQMVDPDGEFVVPMVLGAAISVATNSISNAIDGRNLFDGIGRAALTGAVGGAVSFGIGNVASSLSGAGKIAFQTGAHGLLGGTMSAATGGSFTSGALSGSVSSLVGTGSGELLKGTQSSLAQGIGVVGSGSISGGVSSVVAGGDFWDGARNGAISSGLNHAVHSGALGKGIMMAAITGRTRHLWGPDAVLLARTLDMSAGGTVAGEAGALMILRGEDRGLRWAFDGGTGVATEVGMSTGIELSEYYYSGRVRNLNRNSFMGSRTEFNLNFTALPFVSAGVTVSYAESFHGRMYSVGLTVQAGLSLVEMLPVTYGGNRGNTIVR
jgi:RHS repeat-associated protein